MHSLQPSLCVYIYVLAVQSCYNHPGIKLENFRFLCCATMSFLCRL